MKKPDRVEVGQWWLTGDIPYRVVSVEASPSGFTDMDGPIVTSSDGVSVNNHTMWTSAALAVYEYLGSGSNPEPSEWMIETLAEHLWNSTRNKTGLQWGETYNGHAIDAHTKESEREEVRRILGGAKGRSHIRRFLVLDAYSILRSLGKW